MEGVPFPGLEYTEFCREYMRKINIADLNARISVPRPTPEPDTPGELGDSGEHSRVFNGVSSALASFYTMSHNDWLKLYWHSTISKISSPFKAPEDQLLVNAFDKAVRERCQAVSDVLKAMLTADLVQCIEQYVTFTMDFVVFTEKKMQAMSMLNNLVFLPVTSRSLLGFACKVYFELITKPLRKIADRPDWLEMIKTGIDFNNPETTKKLVDLIGLLDNADGKVWQEANPDDKAPCFFKEYAARFLALFTDMARSYVKVYDDDYSGWYKRFKELSEYGSKHVEYVQNVGFNNTPYLTDDMVSSIVYHTDLKAFAAAMASLAMEEDPSFKKICEWITNRNMAMEKRLELIKAVESAFLDVLFFSPRLQKGGRVLKHCLTLNTIIESLVKDVDREIVNKHLVEVILTKDTKEIMIQMFIDESTANEDSIEISEAGQLDLLMAGNDRVLLQAWAELILPYQVTGVPSLPHRRKVLTNMCHMYRESVPRFVLTSLDKDASKVRPQDPLLLLNLGYWMCSEDSSLTIDAPEEIRSWITSDSVSDIIEKFIAPNVEEHKDKIRIKWHPSWSVVDVKFMDIQFKCSLVQYQVIKMLSESPVPLDASKLLPGYLKSEKELVLNDLVEFSRGFVKQSDPAVEPVVYALDVTSISSEPMMKVRFSDV